MQQSFFADFQAAAAGFCNCCLMLLQLVSLTSNMPLAEPPPSNHQKTTINNNCQPKKVAMAGDFYQQQLQ